MPTRATLQRHMLPPECRPGERPRLASFPSTPPYVRGRRRPHPHHTSSCPPSSPTPRHASKRAPIRFPIAPLHAQATKLGGGRRRNIRHEAAIYVSCHTCAQSKLRRSTTNFLNHTSPTLPRMPSTSLTWQHRAPTRCPALPRPNPPTTPAASHMRLPSGPLAPIHPQMRRCLPFLPLAVPSLTRPAARRPHPASRSQPIAAP